MEGEGNGEGRQARRKRERGERGVEGGRGEGRGEVGVRGVEAVTALPTSALCIVILHSIPGGNELRGEEGRGEVVRELEGWGVKWEKRKGRDKTRRAVCIKLERPFEER